GRSRRRAGAEQRGGGEAGDRGGGDAGPSTRHPPRVRGGGDTPDHAASRKGRNARPAPGVRARVTKYIGYLSFGHWSNSPHSQARTGADTLLQAIDLAVAAEEL